MNVPAAALYPARLSRPDLLVPGAPGPSWARRLVGLREPKFAAVERRIGRLVAIAAVGAIATELLVEGAARPVVLALVAGVGIYAGASAVSLAVLRRRQAGFEPAWLAAQSDVLRGRRFDVLRFTTSEPVRTPHERRAVRRVYDLTRTDEVERLLALRDRAETDGLTIPVTVEFSYPAEDGVCLEQVRGELGSIHFVPGASARVSFPAARYRMQPATERPTTFWVLGLPNITVTRQARDQRSVP